MNLRSKTIGTLAACFAIYGSIVYFGRSAVGEHYSAWSLLGGGIVVLVIASIWLGHSLVARIERLDEFVRNVNDLTDLSRRIDLAGKDELAQLGTNLNSMLEHLEKVTRDLDRALYAAKDAADARSRFLARMSPEIRTPMNGILGMLGLLLESPLSDSQREYAGAVEDSATLLLTIINDILDFSKIEANKLALYEVPVDLMSLVQRTVRVMRPVAEVKGLDLVYVVDPRIPPRVMTDPTRLRQVLNNLIGNAIKFTSAGSVLVNVSVVEGQTGAGCPVRFEVKDTGVGIEDTAMPYLFESFFQVGEQQRRVSGTGLGLAISRQLVELMGGEIKVESTVGSGSTFWFTVDYRIGTASSATFTGVRTEEGYVDFGDGDEWRRNTRILVVDDDDVNRKVALHWLKRAGFRVDIAQNGLEALELLKRYRFHLVLMDTQMPEMDGFETTEAIRALEEPLASIPIIAVTAAALRGDREACLEGGMDDFMPKPIDPHHLVWLVEEHVWPTAERESISADFQSVQPIPPEKLSQDQPMDVEVAIDRLADVGLWRELLSIYLRTTRSRIVELSKAVDEGAIESIRAHAHALKGSSAVLSAEPMRSLCAQLEEVSGDSTKKSAFLLKRLRQEFERLEAQVHELPDAPTMTEN